MRKNILILICCISCTCNLLSQTVSEIKDSLKIDSIKRVLPSLKGTDKIDRMIFICEYYSDKIGDPHMNAADSIRFYGRAISNESKPVGYQKGIAMGMLASAPDSLKEKTARKVLKMAEGAGYDEVSGWAWVVINANVSDMNQSAVNHQQAIYHFNKAGKKLRAAFYNTWLCQIYLSMGENEKAFDCAKKNLETLKAIQSPDLSSIYTQSLLWTLWNMTEIFVAAGDYEQALVYIQKTDEVDKEDNPDNTFGWSLDISGIYIELGKYDSALLYWNRYINQPAWDDESKIWLPGKKLSYNYFAKICMMNREYEKAIQILKENIIYFDSLLNNADGNNKNTGDFGKMAASLLLSSIYDTLKNYSAALEYAKHGYYQAEFKNRRPEMMQASRLLSNAYHHLGNNDSAYKYLSRYVILKDSIQSKQFYLRIYNSKKEAEDLKTEFSISSLKRDNLVKKQQLRQEAILRNFLIVVFIALLFASFYILRNIRLKRKNERLEQEHKSAELKMEALRAQMNPHFIFNCLSSINHFILKNDSREASNYLTRFSRLIRMVLVNSQKPLITLQDELEMLSLYIEMEQLRFKKSFDYAITFLNTVDQDNIFIPPLLFQPFCENAIWHGLMHKDGQGRLDIEISMQGTILNCAITDNGVGRQMAEKMQSGSAKKGKSMGLTLTADRLALINRGKGLTAFYKIEDLQDENGIALGTKVTLKINLNEPVRTPLETIT